MKSCRLKRLTLHLMGLLISLGSAYAAEWEIIRQDEWDTDLNDIYFVNENVGWAVGSRTVIAHTEDGGKTWVKQDANVDRIYNLNRISFPDAKRGWIVGDILLHTEDDGMIVQGDPKGDHYGPIAVGKPDARSSEECKRRGARVARLVKRLAE